MEHPLFNELMENNAKAVSTIVARDLHVDEVVRMGFGRIMLRADVIPVAWTQRQSAVGFAKAAE
jgi:hypothetical protein